MRHISIFGLLLAASLLGGPAKGQQGDGTDVGWSVHVFKPAKVEATRHYGAHTVLAGAGFDDALAAVELGGEALDRRALGEEIRLDGDFDLAGDGAVHASILAKSRSGTNG